MEQWNQQLQGTLEYYRTLKENVTKRLNTAPSGKLLISLCRKKYPQYYKYEKSERGSGGKKIFIPGKNIDLKRALAQKDYDQKLLDELSEQYEILQRFLEEFDPDFIKKIYISLQPYEQELVTPVILPDELFIEKWMSDYHGSQNTRRFETDIVTNRGEQVRSKSEKIIADRLFQRNIPYKYEHPLFLQKSNRNYCPDFYCLNVRTRRTYIWEHIGRTDDANYIADVDDNKLTYYQKDGIFSGENFILTYENQRVPLSQKTIDHMIDTYLV